MGRLLIHVEGITEETFVNEVLGPHLRNYGYMNVKARLLGNTRLRTKRGGIKSWESAKSDIIRHLSSDKNCLYTTMVDYYALPSGNDGWPGRADAQNLIFGNKASIVQNAIKNDIAKTMGDDFYPCRFLPFVMMHEFEAMLFSDCTKFANAIGKPNLSTSLQEIRDCFNSPEEINDSIETAPSKRVMKLFSQYQKPIYGPLVILDIGLTTIKQQCPNFRDWLERLENIDFK